MLALTASAATRTDECGLCAAAIAFCMSDVARARAAVAVTTGSSSSSHKEIGDYGCLVRISYPITTKVEITATSEWLTLSVRSAANNEEIFEQKLYSGSGLASVDEWTGSFSSPLIHCYIYIA
jgi:hypothetical protein